MAVAPQASPFSTLNAIQTLNEIQSSLKEVDNAIQMMHSSKRVQTLGNIGESYRQAARIVSQVDANQLYMELQRLQKGFEV